jgi:hypothetical protein
MKNKTDSLTKPDSAGSMKLDQTVDDNAPRRWRVGRKAVKRLDAVGVPLASGKGKISLP